MPRISKTPAEMQVEAIAHKHSPVPAQGAEPSASEPEADAPSNPSQPFSPLGAAKGVVGFVGTQIGSAGKILAETGGKLSDAVASGYHALRGDVRTWLNPGLPVPADRGGIKVASYNIFMGRKDFAAVCNELRAMQADVICLQEANWETSYKLAQQLGMHLVFHEAESGVTRTVGKAILSRYPIIESENVTYDAAWSGRLRTAVAGGKVEALEDRSMLRATVKIGEREVDIIDTHLSLSNPDANAAQLQQLANYVLSRRESGASVLVAGDFNTNFALVGGAQDAPGQIQTPTDTLAEYVDRYQRHPGNIAHADDAAAVRRLSTLLQSHWQAPAREALTSSGALTPEAALKELPKVKKGSPRHKELLYVLDGISHGGAAKRFDNLLASRDLKLVSSKIDQTAKGSDHWPVLLEVAWKNN